MKKTWIVAAGVLNVHEIESFNPFFNQLLRVCILWQVNKNQTSKIKPNPGCIQNSTWKDRMKGDFGIDLIKIFKKKFKTFSRVDSCVRWTGKRTLLNVLPIIGVWL